MSDELYAFQARDAFVYVDLYRRLKVESTDYVTKERQKLVEKFWNMKELPSRYWAELRAHEHALEWITKRGGEPGLVVLGETDENGQPKESAEAKQRMAELRKCRDDNAVMARNLQQYQLKEKEWQGAMVEKSQEIAKINRRLNQTQSTSTVVGITLLIVILIQFGILFTRG